MITGAIHAHTRSFVFRHLTMNEGLSNNHVKSIYQDTQGFVWLGTRNGLNRFDGRRVRHYTMCDSIAGKSNNVASAIFEDSHGTLWVGTDIGVFLHTKGANDDEWTYFSVRTKDNDWAGGDWVQDIFVDQSNNIWILIPNKGVYRYDEKSGVLHKYVVYPSKDKSDGFAQCIYVDDDGVVWIGTSHAGLYYYNSLEDHFEKVKDTTLDDDFIFSLSGNHASVFIGSHEHGLKRLDKKTGQVEKVFPALDDEVIRFVVWKENALWVGTQNGLYCIEDKKVQHIRPNHTISFGLSDGWIDRVLFDREGGMWVATHFGGANYLPNYPLKFNVIIPQNTPHFHGVRGGRMVEDANGCIWIATQDGGLNCYNPILKRFVALPERLAKGNILALAAQGDTLAVGLFEGGLRLFHHGRVEQLSVDQMHLTQGNIYTLYWDHNHRLWLGDGWNIFSSIDGVHKWRKHTEMGFAFMRDIIQDTTGKYWVATLGQGAFSYYKPYEMASDSVTYYKPILGNNKSISTKELTGVMQHSDGSLWFATDRGGLNKYNPSTQQFTRYTVADGLPSTITYTPVEDKNKRLWLGTEKGIVCLNPATNKMKIYTTADGLPSDQCNFNSSLVTRQGEVYIGTTEGVVHFDPSTMKSVDFNAPVVLTSMDIQGASHLPESAFTIDYNQSSVQFNFVALTFTAPTKVVYRYKLVGADEHWVYTSNASTQRYFLHPGHFELQVQARFADNTWSPLAILTDFRIYPPWYATIWAFLVYIIGVLSIVYWGVRIVYLRRREHDRAVQRQRQLDYERELWGNKVDFFTQIAHDIRTPLTLIVAPLERLEKMQLKEEANYPLEVIRNNTHYLLGLVSQLLDFRKIEEKHSELHIENVNLLELIHQLKEQYQPAMEKQKLRYEVQMPERLQGIQADKSAVLKILHNLYSNALKYADSLIWCVVKQDRDFVSITVSNDGALIDRVQAQQLFLPYTGSQHEYSTGMGLSIARALAQQHGGALHLFTEHGMNSFVLTLPRIQGSVEDKKDKYAATSRCDVPKSNDLLQVVLEDEASLDTLPEINLPKGVKYRVLVVEDHHELRQYIRETLEIRFDVDEAANGDEAWKLLQTVNYNMVITDVMMPGIDGVTLTQMIKDDDKLCVLPVVILSAKSDVLSKLEGAVAGADLYFEKPFLPSVLLTRVTALLANRIREREAFSLDPLFGLQSMHEVENEDQEFLMKAHEYIIHHISDSTYNVEALASDMCMSRSSLHRRVKAIIGDTPVAFIRLIRLKEGARLLREEHGKIQEVSERIGFQSASYFAKQFQQQFGVSPSTYAHNVSTNK